MSTSRSSRARSSPPPPTSWSRGCTTACRCCSTPPITSAGWIRTVKDPEALLPLLRPYARRGDGRDPGLAAREQPPERRPQPPRARRGRPGAAPAHAVLGGSTLTSTPSCGPAKKRRDGGRRARRCAGHGWRPCFAAPAALALGQARLERLHQVHDLRPRPLLGRGHDLLALDLLLRSASRSACGPRLRTARARTASDVICSMSWPARRISASRICRPLRRDLGERPHLVRVVELLHDQASLVRPERDQVVLPARGPPGDRVDAAVLHRLAPAARTPCLPPCRDRGSRAARNRSGPGKSAGTNSAISMPCVARWSSALSSSSVNVDVAVLRVFVALDHLGARHDLLVLRADVLLFQPRAVLFVQQVEGQAGRHAHGRVDTDGHRDQAERDRRRLHRAWCCHDSNLAPARRLRPGYDRDNAHPPHA